MAVEMVVDDKWGELRRETGFGTITDLAQQNGQRNAHLSLKAEQLKEAVTGWIDTTGDRDIHLAALAAFTGGQRVFYRIETRRKTAGDETPFAQLDKRAKTREVKEITAVDGKGVPVTSTLPVAPTPPALNPGPDPEPEPEGEGEARPATRRPGARVAEAKPWEALNSDGSLNLGSFAVTATEAMVELAHELLVARWRAGEVDEPPTDKQLTRIAQMLLTAADKVQAAARADGHADRLDNSHNRARAAIRAALAVHPVPFGAPPPAPSLWADELVATASMFMSVVLALVDREVP